MDDVGDVVELRFDATSAGSYVTPTAVTVTVGLPDGTTATLTPVATATGRYLATYVPVQAGRHVVRWVATGPGARAAADVFNAGSGSLALCSLAGAKQHLNMTTDVDDEELREHIEAATGVIERHRGEVVAQRVFTATLRAGDVVPHRPVVRVTGAVLEGTATSVDVSGWVPDVVSGLLTVPRYGSTTAFDASRPLRASGEYRPRYLVTYTAGYVVVPREFVLASEIIASHLWESQRTQVTGPTSGFASADVLTSSGRGYAIPTRAVELLGGRVPVIA